MECENEINFESENIAKKCKSNDEDSISSLSDSSSSSDSSLSNKSNSIDEEAENPLWLEETLGQPIEDWLPPCNPLPIEPLPKDFSNIFEWFFSEDILTLIARETNSYARKSLKMYCEVHSKKKETQDIEGYINKRWKDTTIEEIKNFLGLAILMGMIKKPMIQDYWSQEYKIVTPIFNTIMTKNRFMDLMKYLHLCPTKTVGTYYHVKKNDRLEKIGYLLELLKKKWNQYKVPSKNLTIDESMISFKGKICFRQYIPRKKHKWGIKCWVMAGSTDSYIYEVQIYTGKTDVAESNIGKRVVLDLSKNLQPGHILYFDSYFSSISLFEELTKKGIGAVGMIKKNTKGLPKPFYNTKINSGEAQCLVNRDYPNIKAMKSKDSKMYFCMTNCSGTSTVEVQKFSSKEQSFVKVKKLEAVAKYMENMHGVDRFDQMCSYYSYKRKTLKWWKHVFFYLLEVSISNAYIIWREQSGQKNIPRKAFRIAVVEKLFEKNERYQAAVRRSFDKISGYHFPLLYDGDYRGICVNCLKQRKKKVQSKYYCETCEVPLCVDCFLEFHEKIDQYYEFNV